MDFFIYLFFYRKVKRYEIYLFNEHLLAKQPVLFYLSLVRPGREVQKTLPPSEIYSLSQKASVWKCRSHSPMGLCHHL